VQAVVVPVLAANPPREGWRLSGRDMFNPASLAALQDAWEARLTPLGVGPRQKGSTARHVPLATFYAAARNPPPVPNLTPSPPPPQALVPVLGREALRTWQQSETKKARKRIKPLEAKAAAAALYESERRGADQLRGHLRDTGDRVRDLLGEVAALGQKLEISRDQIARLRGVPINTVAAALAYTGTIEKRENAIDLVKRVGGLDFDGALAWLHHAFGPSTASEAFCSDLVTSPPPVVLTKQDQTKAKAIQQQLDALAAPSYRVTLMRNIAGDQVGQNLGKSKEEAEEKTWTKSEILNMIPALTAQNAAGANVFITPIDPSARHVLIDDLTQANVIDLKTRGYQPATIIETSPSNYQAIVKVSSDLDQHTTNEWFKAMNRELGDRKITGLTHPFRLAGFQNRKEKHKQADGRFPFVVVVHAVNQFCATARRVISAMSERIYGGDLKPPKQ
ncbi:MAG: DNA-primase RepB domain-containing protein, partial [bacterium]